MNFLIILSLTCPAVDIINSTNTWNKQDEKALSTAIKHCDVQFPGNPCLITFRKVEEGVYSALCGVKR